MRKVCFFAIMTMMCATAVNSQVFGFRRPNVWYVQTSPSLGFFLGHSGMDLESGTTVSEIFSWGAGLNVDFGANARRFSFNNTLRMEYVESHAADMIPVKGPSLFEFATRPAYTLVRDTSSSLGMAFQGGCNTALTQETNSDGGTTRKFFDPANVYEGLFLSADVLAGGQGELRMSFQFGYSLQQLIYQAGNETQEEGGFGQDGANSSGGGATAFLAISYTQRTVPSITEQRQMGFFADLSIKGFRKEPGFADMKQSRVEGSLRVGLDVFQFVEFLTSAEVIYDSSISPRRELRTSVSINFRYNMDLSGRF